MSKLILSAALLAIALPTAPAIARTMNGYTVRATTMRAGPDIDYPAVLRLRRQTGITVYGCLRDWSWCDVRAWRERGWVRQRDINVDYRGRRRPISPQIGLSIQLFIFRDYWDSHYSSHRFYSERPRWEDRYYQQHRAEWGPLPDRRSPSVQRAPDADRVQPQGHGAPVKATPPQRVKPQKERPPVDSDRTDEHRPRTP